MNTLSYVYVYKSATGPLWPERSVWCLGWSLEGLYWMILRDPPPPLPRRPAWPRLTFLEAIFKCFFISFIFVLWSRFDRFWREHGPNLPPKLDPKSIKILSKRVPNLMPTCIMLSMSFTIEFWSLLSVFGVFFACCFFLFLVFLLVPCLGFLFDGRMDAYIDAYIDRCIDLLDCLLDFECWIVVFFFNSLSTVWSSRQIKCNYVFVCLYVCLSASLFICLCFFRSVYPWVIYFLYTWKTWFFLCQCKLGHPYLSMGQFVCICLFLVKCASTCGWVNICLSVWLSVCFSVSQLDMDNVFGMAVTLCVFFRTSDSMCETCS